MWDHVFERAHIKWKSVEGAGEHRYGCDIQVIRGRQASMINMLLKASVVLALLLPLSGCSAVRVADATVGTAVFAGTTAVRGAAAGGRLITGTGREECGDGRRRNSC
jgi:hypothetical protein